MYGTYDVVTIWNRYRDPQTKKDKWVRHEAPLDCCWSEKAIRQINGGTAAVDKTTMVILPYSDRYKTFDEWMALDDLQKKEFFTISLGDVVSKGFHALEITGEGENTLAKTKEALAPNVFQVGVFGDNTTPPRGKHYYIEGV